MSEFQVLIKLRADGSVAVQGFNQVGTSLDRLNTSARQSSGVFKEMGTAVKGSIAAFGVLGVARFAGEFNELGVSVIRAESTFNQLNGGVGRATTLLASLREATGNVVDDLALMSGANQLVSMGLGTTQEEISRLTELAVKLGSAMGNDAARSIDEFSKLLANQSVLRLDTFGISSARVKERIDELLASGQALNREDAFRMAVLEEGGRSLERLGDAATVGESALAKLQTRMSNFFQQGAQNFAIGLEAIIGYLDAIGMHRSLQQQESANALVALLARNFDKVYGEGAFGGRRLARQWMEDFTQTIRTGMSGFNSLVSGAFTDSMSAAMNSYQMRETLDILLYHAGTFSNRLADMVTLPHAMPGFGPAGQMFRPEELETARHALTQLYGIQREVVMAFEAGFATQEQLDNFDAMVKSAEQLYQAVHKGAVEMERLTLAQTLGTDAASPLITQGTDALLKFLEGRGYESEDLTPLQNILDLTSGRQTELSQYFEGQALPAFADIYEQFGAEVAAESYTAFLEGLRAAEAGFAPIPHDPLWLAGFMRVGGTGGGGSYTVKSGDSPWDIARANNMSLDEFYRRTGVKPGEYIHPGQQLNLGSGGTGGLANLRSIAGAEGPLADFNLAAVGLGEAPALDFSAPQAQLESMTTSLDTVLGSFDTLSTISLPETVGQFGDVEGKLQSIAWRTSDVVKDVDAITITGLPGAVATTDTWYNTTKNVHNAVIDVDKALNAIHGKVIEVTMKLNPEGERILRQLVRSEVLEMTGGGRSQPR